MLAVLTAVSPRANLAKLASPPGSPNTTIGLPVRWAAAEGYPQPYDRDSGVSAAVASRLLRSPTVAGSNSLPPRPGATPPYAASRRAGSHPHSPTASPTAQQADPATASGAGGRR
jgi:hypothetical protein